MQKWIEWYLYFSTVVTIKSNKLRIILDSCLTHKMINMALDYFKPETPSQNLCHANMGSARERRGKSNHKVRFLSSCTPVFFHLSSHSRFLRQVPFLHPILNHFCFMSSFLFLSWALNLFFAQIHGAAKDKRHRESYNWPHRGRLAYLQGWRTSAQVSIIF